MEAIFRLLYKPFGMLAGVASGLVASAIFKRIWQAVAHEDDTPDAKDKHRSWVEVIPAAAVHGAVFATVKAIVDRATATGYERLTGVWPGKIEARAKR
jgi:Protein of unknown function (DUF4235)